MSLSEIMSGAGLSRYAEAALLLFFFAFLVILWQKWGARTHCART